MVLDLGEGDGVKSGERKVRYVEEPDTVPVFQTFEWHESERSRSLKEIAGCIVAADQVSVKLFCSLHVDIHIFTR